jgi:A/G-specific adenine glycosylase
LPWKEDRDPYKIWLSEIILQQTRVEQGLPYYERLLKAFPTVQDLAQAPQELVMKHWQGLGYYSRARNLQAAAQQVLEQHRGKFPQTYAELRALKGVGDYTAAAIASFAFDLPHAVLDGNVYRVLARYFGMDLPIDSPAAKKVFQAKAQELLPPAQAAAYNQALMDFGATHCKPKQPHCAHCPMQDNCQAYTLGLVEKLPVKAKKLEKKNRYFNYLYLVQPQGHFYVQERTAKDIWQQLYELPLLESPQELEKPNHHPNYLTLGLNANISWQLVWQTQEVLSHQNIFLKIWQAEAVVDAPQTTWRLVDLEQVGRQYALPKGLVNFFKTINV